MAAQGTNGGSSSGGGSGEGGAPPQPQAPPPPMPPPRPQYPPTHRGVLYRSTRGCRKDVTFEEVVMSGLAPDRGLYVPQEIPHIAPEQLDKLKDASFVELANYIMRLFIGPEDIPPENLRVLLEASTKNFRTHEVTPVRKVGPTWVLELFHGPTFAFKDVALQFLGNLFEYFLAKRKGQQDARLTILGATSGDTGSAAIHGLRGKKNVQVFILYPKGRVSEVQEKQMTTVLDRNVHCVGVEGGTFDDCQEIVKECFQDPAFRDRVSLGAVNSINWARVLAQITYYFYAYFRVTAKLERLAKQQERQAAQQAAAAAQAEGKDASGINPPSVERDSSLGSMESASGGGAEGGGQSNKKPKAGRVKLNFSIPTGNFGDALAGYYAKAMGLPIDKLIVATNDNDILHRFFASGKYWKEDVKATLSPSMDISISSNFERLLFDLAGRDPELLRAWMTEFEFTDRLTLPPPTLGKAREDFLSARVDERMTVKTIAEFQREHNYLLCPHSAVGVAAAKQLGLLNSTTVCLATAHYAKFLTATLGPLEEVDEDLDVEAIEEGIPSQLHELEHLPTQAATLPPSAYCVKALLTRTVEGQDTSLLLKGLALSARFWPYWGNGKKGRRRRRRRQGTAASGWSGSGNGGDLRRAWSSVALFVAATGVAATAAVLGARRLLPPGGNGAKR